MLFDGSKSISKLVESGWDEERPYWSYEDIGIFLLVLSTLSTILHLCAYFHLFPRSQLAHPRLALQISVIVTLMLALYLVLKLRYRRAVLRPLGWIWPRVAVVILAPLLGGSFASAVALCSQGYAHDTRTTPFVGLIVLGVALGPVLEESFFRGCILPVLACSLGTTSAVILSAFLFALFHGPADLVQWLLLTSTGIAYGWMRVTSRSTTTPALAHAAYNLVLVLFARF